MEDNAGIYETPKEILEQREQAKLEAIKLSAFVTGIMSNKNGRDFVWHLLNEFGLYRSPFDINSNQMARRVGYQEAGQYLVQLILLECPQEYELMFAENKYKEKADE